jgi:transcription antitermination factor NusG
MVKIGKFTSDKSGGRIGVCRNLPHGLGGCVPKSNSNMILADLPVVTPDAVLRLPQDMKQGGSCWWLLWTESQRERRLSVALNECGAVPVLITNVRVKTRLDGRGRSFKERKEIALFSGYVFANGTAEQVWDARAKQKAQIVGIAQQSRTAEQVARIIRLSASLENLVATKIEPGTQVEVTRGPLLGSRGLVTAARPGVVFFECEILGRMVPTEIPSDFVEPV